MKCYTDILLPATGSSLMDNDPQFGHRIVYSDVSVSVRAYITIEVRKEKLTFIGRESHSDRSQPNRADI